jgi:Uma2 family endonuclease
MSGVLSANPSRAKNPARIEPLENGDRLTAVEFMRRYAATTHVKKAELVEGIVYMPSPVRFQDHSVPDSLVQFWLMSYAVETPGTQVGGNGTIKLDLDNVLQPDAALRIVEECGGSSHIDEKGYLVGPPELVIEIAASSNSIDLHDKLGAYRRNGVKEYLVWRTAEENFDWFVLREGNYMPQSPDSKGLCHSSSFPGLVLNVNALLQRDAASILTALHAGLKSKAHRVFVSQLASRKSGKQH